MANFSFVFFTAIKNKNIKIGGYHDSNFTFEKDERTGYKISAMESLWENLCQNADDIASPEWHKDVLKEREKDLKSGADPFLDWEDTKTQIREKIQHGQTRTRLES